MESLFQVVAIAYLFAVVFLLVAVPRAIQRDMSRRGRTAWTYVLLTLVLPPLGLMVWYVDRRRFPVLR